MSKKKDDKKEVKKDAPKGNVYNNINLDELLAKLSTEQLEDLHTELIDPDDSMVPPCDRCRYKTDKAPTGPYNRKKLLDFLEKKAKEEKDWEEEKPYSKEKKGKEWKAKEEEKIKLHDNESISTEWDHILNKASEAELVDLAAILGFHGMLNQVQYHQAFVEGKDSKSTTGFQSVAKYSDFKSFERAKPNQVDVEKVLEEVEKNSEEIKEINLNNLKKIDIKKLCDMIEKLEKNTKVTSLLIANTRATDKVARTIAKIIKTNITLKSINIESNYISGKAIVELLEAINVNQSVVEFRFSNQKPQTMGVQNEMMIAQLMKENKKIIKIGVYLEIRTARLLVLRYVERNIDNLRKERRGESTEENVKKEEKKEEKKVDSDVSSDEDSD